MAFCGNIVELVQKRKVLNDSVGFVKWNQFDGDYDVEVYIEDTLVEEFKDKTMLLIDAALGEVKGKTIGMLFIKKDSNVYG
ncbi:MAG: hypothetical protein BAJALOKI1v1_470005 [Promethearchaeota archaeon]|nr:MAG: hypothetical protein BAJALOKI1v1_470005 [Candidatus Lokiarchaeota archaeon]